MQESSFSLEKVILLGLLPLLGGTTHLQTSFFIVLTCLVGALLLRLFSYPLKNMKKEEAWIIYLAIGLAFSYGIFNLLPFIFPIPFGNIRIYLLLIGVTPILYLGCTEGVSWGEFFKSYLTFALLMIFLTIIRETLGKGVFLGIPFMKAGYAPLEVFAGPGGAYIGLASIWLVIRICLASSNQKNINHRRKAICLR